jgi:RNA polymerase sigma factor for flagellar operon FliA
MATLPSPPPDLTPEQLYLGHLKLIDEVAEHAARGRRFSREETEDFVSTVRFKLFEKNYETIRQFQGKSSFRTYITVVIGRLFKDYCNRMWGKWRPSEEAKRLGPVAVRLDVLLHRERLPLDEVCEYLRTNEHVELSREQLADLAGRLPPHNPPRRTEGEEVLADRPAEGESPEERVRAREVAERRKKVRGILRKALASLPKEDLLITQMRYEFQVSQIAKSLHLEQKPLYRRLEKIFKTLREQLEKEGIRWEDVAEILSFPERDFQ